MAEGHNADTRNLTGVWQGIYTYRDQSLAVSFVATLLESGSSLTGTTHEPCSIGGSSDQTMFATLTGSRHHSAVHFVKTYEGSNPFYRTVVYEGTLNHDATEIEGRWTIPGNWSGRFMMMRPERAGETVSQDVSVTA